MNQRIVEIAERIRELREIMGITVDEMAAATDISPSEYLEFESGRVDFPFTFLYKFAETCRVDMTEILTGVEPKLSFYSVVRKNKGLPIRRLEGFTYEHMAYLFKDRMAEPFIVTAPYREQEQHMPIYCTTHEGQEFDFILSGTLKVSMDGHIEILNEGDAIFYDSSHPHGMVATGGETCVFLALVLKPKE